MKKKYGTLFQILFLLTFCLSAAEVPAYSNTIENAIKQQEKSIVEKLENQWTGTGKLKLNLELKFKLTKAGDAYDITIIKGFKNPYAIRLALHTILFSMPYTSAKKEQQKTRVVNCSFNGTFDNPTIVANIETTDIEKESLSQKLPDISKYEKTMFLGIKFKPLMKLCNILYEYPDSSLVRNKIVKLLSTAGLSCDKAHDWTCIGRAMPRGLIISRNVSSLKVNNFRQAIAAFFEAYKLNGQKSVRYELEEAYLRLLAAQTLNESKADPILLASAAILARNYKTAIEQYKVAFKEGNTDARMMLACLRTPVSKNSQRPQKNSQIELIGRSTQGWKTLLNWLPRDSELLVVGQSINKTDPQRGLKEISLFCNRNMKNGTRNFYEAMQRDKLFQDSKLLFSLHSARRFRFGGGLGLGTADCADVLIFDKESIPIVKTALGKLRASSPTFESISGVEISCFDNYPFTIGRFIGLPNEPVNQYICSPANGIILCSNDITYLREVLFRMNSKEAKPAFPKDLPEWQHVDTTSNLWCLRHYDRSYVPFGSSGMYSIVGSHLISQGAKKGTKSFNKTKYSVETNDEVGLTFYKSGKKVYINCLSNNQLTLKGLETKWEHIFSYKHAIKQQESINKTYKSKISNNLLTIEGVPDTPGIFLMQLFESMGYFVAI